jgi:hypothetical protein
VASVLANSFDGNSEEPATTAAAERNVRRERSFGMIKNLPAT